MTMSKTKFVITLLLILAVWNLFDEDEDTLASIDSLEITQPVSTGQ